MTFNEDDMPSMYRKTLNDVPVSEKEERTRLQVEFRSPPELNNEDQTGDEIGEKIENVSDEINEGSIQDITGDLENPLVIIS